MGFFLNPFSGQFDYYKSASDLGAVTFVNGLTGGVPLTGTVNRITISASNVFDISASYVGQSSITTVGTLSSGAVPTTLLTGVLQATQFPALTGDVTTIAGALATTLATVNSNVGTFGSATQSTQITVNGKGLITAIANVTITPAVGSITGLGTGVATALGVNVGSAGSFVVNGGALGTPSSGTATNLSGTAASLTAGAVTNATFTTALTVNGGTLTLTANAANTSVLTIGAGAVSVSGANTGDQTITLTGAVTGSGTGSFATTIATPGTLTVSSTNSTATAHTHTITSSSAPGAAASLLATDASGIIGSTGTRIVKIWATDLTVTNAITGSVTGSAASWTTARNLAGNSVDGSANVAFANKFIVQGTADAGLSAAQFLGALGTGIVKNTTTTGILSIAVAGDFPTLNQSTTGSAATLTTVRTIWGQNFDGSGNVTGSLTSIGNITGGASSMTITAGTGNSRTLALQSTTSGGVATTFLTGDASQNTTLAGNLTLGASTSSITGAAGNMTIVAGTGNSRTLTLQSTTSGGVATNGIVIDAAQHITLEGVTSTGATGTGKFVFDGSPTIVTPTFTTNFTSPIWKPASNSTTAIQINKADGTTNILNVDTTNSRVGIGTASPKLALDVNGTAIIGGGTDSGGNTLVISTVSGGAFLDMHTGVFATDATLIFYASNSLQGVFGTASNHDLFIRTNNTVHMTILKTGEVGIGMTPTKLLELATDSAQKPTTNTWTITSDERVKKDFKPYTKGLAEILQIKPTMYHFNGKGHMAEEKETDPYHVSVVAQELDKVLPELITHTDGEIDGVKTDILGYSGHDVVFMLINAVKELKAEIDELKNINN